MKVGILDYGAGNVQSVQFALQRLGYSAKLSANVDELNACDKIIFPGVGHAKPAMARLRERNLDRFILECNKPLLGICLGMQLLCSHSEEGDTDCVGVFDVPVKLFNSSELKIPHVGWNTLHNTNGKIFNSDFENASVYFVHSYFVPENSYTVATCDYGQKFSAALERDNFFGMQFHPEKSGVAGEKLLGRFLAL
ncbi:MAG TPA: imidazole glycerol phosphate synthase subunit HisH [Flavobacteriales bacterium]|nr:imidazole glycerol phosphate synthase subunit HisH [Flavobacteriales bacterium]